MRYRTGAVCPACSGKRARSRFRGAQINGYGVLQCRLCGLAYCWPRPTEDELSEFYAAEYFSSEAATGYASYRDLPESNARRQWYELRARYFNFMAERGSVLDVGCATGGFLGEAAASGWSVHGTEMSEWAADAARLTYGLKVDAGTLIPRDPGLRFDLITMWQVLEHLVDPRTAVGEIHSFLAYWRTAIHRGSELGQFRADGTGPSLGAAAAAGAHQFLFQAVVSCAPRRYGDDGASIRHVLPVTDRPGTSLRYGNRQSESIVRARPRVRGRGRLSQGACAETA